MFSIDIIRAFNKTTWLISKLIISEVFPSIIKIVGYSLNSEKKKLEFLFDKILKFFKKTKIYIIIRFIKEIWESEAMKIIELCENIFCIKKLLMLAWQLEKWNIISEIWIETSWIVK